MSKKQALKVLLKSFSKQKIKERLNEALSHDLWFYMNLMVGSYHFH